MCKYKGIQNVKKRNPDLVRYYELEDDEELEGYMNPDAIEEYLDKYKDVPKIDYKDESDDPHMLAYEKEKPAELNKVIPPHLQKISGQPTKKQIQRKSNSAVDQAPMIKINNKNELQLPLDIGVINEIEEGIP